MKPIYWSERDFRFWDYGVSHRQLLIRSLRSGNEQSHIDVRFWGVEWINMCPDFRGLTIYHREFTADDLTSFPIERYEALDALRIYVLESRDGKRGQVMAAAGVEVAETTLEMHETSLYGVGKETYREYEKRVLCRYLCPGPSSPDVEYTP